ncbi:hypothetical protein MSAN_01194300 [Mycena sanguinolenta]|uniref:Uncharacterized protein n=1 Tax=Mycena sanguinolenta TaxID=230812 RepID=A0A8H6YH12_9AGAR|nr:hypothetical protein MSAN_01194300 [Mycena sanguinolenta]
MASHPKSGYFCDCAEYCNSVRQPVSRSTWYTHAPYRNLSTLHSFNDYAAGLGLSIDGDLANTDTRPLKKRRLASPVKPDSLPGSQSSQRSEGLARMEHSDDPPELPVGDSDGFGQSLPEEDDVPDPGSLADPLDENEDMQDMHEPTSLPSPILSPQQLDNQTDAPRQNIPPAPPRPIHEPLSAVEDIRTAQLFIRALEGASLDDSGLDAEILSPSQNSPRGAEDLGGGYVLKRAKDEYNQIIRGAQGDAIKDYLEAVHGEEYPDAFRPSLQRWARLQLPNGQIVRGAWKEKQKALNKIRMARNVRIPSPGKNLMEKSNFFFQTEIEDETVTVALIQRYSGPDENLLDMSSKVLWVCDALDEEAPMEVIEVESISSVVGMVPFDDAGRVFVVHKLGLELTGMSGTVEKDIDE